MTKYFPLLILIFAFSVFGQENECPEIKYGNDNLLSVNNLNSSLKKDFTCNLKTIKGVITGLDFEDDISTDISAIVIQISDGRRHRINFFSEFVKDCFSEADRRNWESILVKGAKVTVKAYGCGMAGDSDLAIASIDFTAPIKRINKKRKN